MSPGTARSSGPNDGKPGASRERIYARSVTNRRVTFLALATWTITVIEDLPDEAAFRRFEEELQRARVASGWGSQPWSRATEQDQFLKHVDRLAEGFTTGNGVYAARTTD